MGEAESLFESVKTRGIFRFTFAASDLPSEVSRAKLPFTIKTPNDKSLRRVAHAIFGGAPR